MQLIAFAYGIDKCKQNGYGCLDLVETLVHGQLTDDNIIGRLLRGEGDFLPFLGGEEVKGIPFTQRERESSICQPIQ